MILRRESSSVVQLLAFCAALACAAVSIGQDADEGFVPLFNGTDLTGWELHEGQPLVALEGALTGNPLGPGMIRTTQRYGDFVLRLEYWVDRGDTHEANGGIFFRVGEGDPPGEGYESQISLEDGLNPSASIFGIVPQNLELVRSIAPERQWNQVEIRAVGPRIQIKYNGLILQDATLHEFASGSIALQHHHNGCTIKYRNIRIMELGPEDAEEGWEAIPIAEDLDGWTAQGKATWEVRERTLVGTGALGNIYYTAREFANFELRLMARINAQGNSGVLFRSHWPESDPADYAVGFECQIDNWDKPNTTGLKNVTGGIYGRAYAPLFTRDDAWFALRIRADGDHLRTWVNGRLVADIRDASFSSGWFAIQCFSAETTIEIRDLLVRPLP